MFSAKEPSRDELERFLSHQRRLPLSYGEAGATLGEAPAGYTVDHHRVRLGAGAEDFRRAVEALRAWRMFETGWTAVYPQGALVREGGVVCVVARHFGLYSVNPARIIRVLDEDVHYRRYGFVYGTLPGHSERGEERFSVEHLPDGSVWYDLYSFARGGGALVRLGYPVRRLVQRRFARDSQRAMVGAVRNPAEKTAAEIH